MTNQETNIMRRIMLACSEAPGVTLWRNNVGLGWSGRVIRHDHAADTVLLGVARPVKFGLHKGSGDLVGLRQMTITPDMVGRTVAVFASLEVKTGAGRPTPEQIQWDAFIRGAGGISAVVRSPEAAVEAVTHG